MFQVRQGRTGGTCAVFLGQKDPQAFRDNCASVAEVGIMGKRLRADSPLDDIHPYFFEDGQVKMRPTLCVKCLQVCR